MPMKLDEWDAKIKPILQDIEYRASMIALHTERIAEQMASICNTPDFPTRAEAAMEDAITIIHKAADSMEQSKRAFMAKTANV